MIIGTCSICGGRVSTPDLWMGVNPPIPECQRCGATPKKPYGQTIEMERPKPILPMVK